MKTSRASRLVARRTTIAALWLNAHLSRFGFRVARVNRRPLANAYVAALCALESALGRPLKIVVVGANDGKWNDPLYPWLTIASQKPQVLFCEPQLEIVERLSKNVSSLCESTIEACAISSHDGQFSLFRVRPRYWQNMSTTYMTEAPAYRAPSGIASADRQRVESFVQKFSGLEPEVAVEELVVPAYRMGSLLRKNTGFLGFDVLQVDAEGHDDIVVTSSLEDARPLVVLFESTGLSPDKVAALHNLSQSLGYRAFEMGRDTLLIAGRDAEHPHLSPLS